MKKWSKPTKLQSQLSKLEARQASEKRTRATRGGHDEMYRPKHYIWCDDKGCIGYPKPGGPTR